MKTLTLVPKDVTSIPVEAEAISPNMVAGKTLADVRRLSVYQGKVKLTLADHFDVTGKVAENPAEQMIVVNGNTPHVKYIGAGMDAGNILIKGDTGMHAGSQMAGGELTVEGNAADWAGAEMKGGLLRINGDAGHLMGAAYRGSSEGMTGGCIVVGGGVGSEAASFMRRGMVVVRGGTAPFTGVHMNGGEIFVFGKAGKRLGAEAKGNGGFIACFGETEELLPTYLYDTTYRPIFMRIYLRRLAETLNVEEALRFIDTPLRRYRGDLAVGGKAEILIAEP
ncbi:formylmethanofuran dehydrogenase subunit C [Candidatus Bathyarchaeota archaeon]|nr:formylmethanofuran dehydrogenase subunit C [Candidatus Bathyarchaeota archaeon]